LPAGTRPLKLSKASAFKEKFINRDLKGQSPFMPAGKRGYLGLSRVEPLIARRHEAPTIFKGVAFDMAKKKAVLK